MRRLLLLLLLRLPLFSLACSRVRWRLHARLPLHVTHVCVMAHIRTSARSTCCKWKKASPRPTAQSSTSKRSARTGPGCWRWAAPTRPWGSCRRPTRTPRQSTHRTHTPAPLGRPSNGCRLTLFGSPRSSLRHILAGAPTQQVTTKMGAESAPPERHPPAAAPTRSRLGEEHLEVCHIRARGGGGHSMGCQRASGAAGVVERVLQFTARYLFVFSRCRSFTSSESSSVRPCLPFPYLSLSLSCLSHRRVWCRSRSTGASTRWLPLKCASSPRRPTSPSAPAKPRLGSLLKCTDPW